METEQLRALIGQVFSSCSENTIPAQKALLPELSGAQIFEAPIFCVAAADDPLYAKLTQPEVIGPWHMGPEEWLPGAKAVISIFFPFT